MQLNNIIMQKQNSILWLPGWYPSRVDFLSGDFIERHAKAASKFNYIIILFVVRDIQMRPGTFNIEVKGCENMTSYIGYYNSTNKFGITGKIISVIKYFLLLNKLFKIIQKKFNHFDLIHVHISLRQGLFAQWLYFRRKIKYVITEQNSWFMPADKISYPKSFLFKEIIRRNFKYAQAIHVVSERLGKELQSKFPFITNYYVIPNVVNTDIFFYKPTNKSDLSLNFFAINGNLFHKNIDGIIRAFANFLKTGEKAILHIGGNENALLVALVKQLNLAKNVIFYGLINNKKVAEIMQQSDAFIFFSRFETFGCVLAEANCCGVPVIASNLEVLKENLQQDENALFVLSEDEKSLTEKLIFFAKNNNFFVNEQIALVACAKYNFTTVGKNFLLFYRSVLHVK